MIIIDPAPALPWPLWLIENPIATKKRKVNETGKDGPGRNQEMKSSDNSAIIGSRDAGEA